MIDGITHIQDALAFRYMIGKEMMEKKIIIENIMATGQTHIAKTPQNHYDMLSCIYDKLNKIIAELEKEMEKTQSEEDNDN